MRNVTSIALAFAAATALALPAIARANCYSVYDAQNRLTYQSAVAPIDLSRRISDAMGTRFPNAYLVMIPDESACREVRTGAVTQPRFDALGLGSTPDPADRAMAAPLLRNTRTGSSSIADAPLSGGSGGSGGSGELAQREAVRSGTSLNLKREPANSRP